MWKFARGRHEAAIRNARDVYTRRNEIVSIWVVEASAIQASSPETKAHFTNPAV